MTVTGTIADILSVDFLRGCTGLGRIGKGNGINTGSRTGGRIGGRTGSRIGGLAFSSGEISSPTTVVDKQKITKKKTSIFIFRFLSNEPDFIKV